MFDLIVKGGDVVLPHADPTPFDIAITDGKIAALLVPGTPVEAKQVVDASGKTVLPGALDVHVHLGHGNDISRPREASDAETETAAAIAGGVTTIVPFILAAEEHSGIFKDIVATTEAGSFIDFGYHLIISTEEQLAAVPRYIEEFGVPTFKIFMNNRNGEGQRLGLPDIDDGFLYRLAEACAAHGGMVCPHPENIEVVHYLRQAAMAADPDGKSGLAGWDQTRPAFVEADAIQRAALLCKSAGSPVYVVHTSSAEALEAALMAREWGADIIIETCPHYLTHDITWPGGDTGKINPPLRSPEDREVLWQALAEGLIDTIASDHVHRTQAAKQGGIWKASPGCPGLETLLPILITEGYGERGIALRRIVELVSERPAKATGLWGRKGGIVPGFDADLAIVDLNESYVLTKDMLKSDAGYSIYEGRTFNGKVTDTFVRGHHVLKDGVVDSALSGIGRYQRRALGPN